MSTIDLYDPKQTAIKPNIIINVVLMIRRYLCFPYVEFQNVAISNIAGQMKVSVEMHNAPVNEITRSRCGIHIAMKTIEEDISFVVKISTHFAPYMLE